jgi:hypothetical protein
VSDRDVLKDRVFLGIAHDLGQLGTCDRKRVGALIVKDGRCVSWGFNGAPPGLPHCEENNHGWDPLRPDDPEGYLSRRLGSIGCLNATRAQGTRACGTSGDRGWWSLYVRCRNARLNSVRSMVS